MVKKVLISSCLVCSSLLSDLIDQDKIQSDKAGLLLGTFSAKEEALGIIKKYPHFDTYIKKSEDSYDVFILNIKQNEYDIVYDIVKRKISGATKLSFSEIDQLALAKKSFQHFNESSAVLSDNIIDTSKKALVLGSYKTLKSAQRLKELYPSLNIVVKKTEGKNGIYFVPYCVNIEKENISKVLQIVKKKVPNAYVTSDNQVNVLAQYFNQNDSKESKTNLASKNINIQKNDQNKVQTVSINTKLPDEDFFSDLFEDDYYLDKVQKKQENKKAQEKSNYKDEQIKKEFQRDSLEDLKISTASQSDIFVDTSKKAIALGAFLTQEQAYGVRSKFPKDKIAVKKVVGTKGEYFVPYSINISKDGLSYNLSRIKQIVPTAYIASDKRVLDLAEIYNKDIEKSSLAFTDIDKKEQKSKESKEIVLEEKNISENSNIDFSKSLKNFDLSKRALTVAKAKTLEEAKQIIKNLNKYDVFIKSPLIPSAMYAIHIINLDKDLLSKVKNELKDFYPDIYETSRTRVNYFARRSLPDDLFVAKNTTNSKDTRIVKKTDSNILNESEFEKGLTFFRNKKYPQALEVFQNLSKNNQDDKDLNFYIGRTLYELGEYESASSYFERVTIKDDTNLRAKLELAQTYLKLELFDAAVDNFNSVLQNDLPKMVRENIENRLSYIEDQKKKHFIYGKIGFKVISDNNSYNVSDTKFFNTLNYQGLEVTDEKYHEISKTVDFNLNYIYKISNNYSLKNSLNGIKRVYDKDDLRLNDSSLTGISKEKKKEQDIVSYGLQLSKTSQNDMISGGFDISKTYEADDEYLQTKGFELAYQRMFFKKIKSMMSVKIYNKSYQELKDKNLDSNNFQFMFGQMLPTSNFGTFNLAYIYGYEKKTDPFINGLANKTSDKDSHGLFLSNYYELTNYFSLQTGLYYSVLDTKDEDSTYDIFGIRRKDEVQSVFAQLQYALNKNIVLNTGVKYLQNDSNIDIYSYDKILLDFGFSYNF